MEKKLKLTRSKKGPDWYHIKFLTDDFGWKEVVDDLVPFVFDIEEDKSALPGLSWSYKVGLYLLDGAFYHFDGSYFGQPKGTWVKGHKAGKFLAHFYDTNLGLFKKVPGDKKDLFLEAYQKIAEIYNKKGRPYQDFIYKDPDPVMVEMAPEIAEISTAMQRGTLSGRRICKGPIIRNKLYLPSVDITIDIESVEDINKEEHPYGDCNVRSPDDWPYFDDELHNMIIYPCVKAVDSKTGDKIYIVLKDLSDAEFDILFYYKKSLNSLQNETVYLDIHLAKEPQNDPREVGFRLAIASEWLCWMNPFKGVRDCL